MYAIEHYAVFCECSSEGIIEIRSVSVRVIVEIKDVAYDSNL